MDVKGCARIPVWTHTSIEERSDDDGTMERESARLLSSVLVHRTVDAMKRVHRFLDIEARVDNEEVEEDEDEERDLLDAFIDDQVDPEDDVDRQNALPHLSDDQMNNSSEEALDEFLGQILADADVYKDLQSFAFMNNERELDERTVYRAIAGLPSEDDYPLWKVDCRIGTEELAVISLTKTARDKHGLRSAFTRGSIRGGIYLECKMNHHLIRLLELTPGIIRSQLGIRRRLVEPSDYMSTLTIKNVKVDISVGDWIQVKKGLYRGDIGFVASTCNWGVRVLLVPRVASTPMGSTQKRKASAVKPAPQLFKPDEFRGSSNPGLISRHDGSYSLGCLVFEHGLVRKDFDYHSVALGVRDIPFHHFSMFRLSKHPGMELSLLPRPREWSFEEDDPVVVCSSEKEGRLKVVEAYYAEVELAEEGVHRVPWYDIRKNIAVGQFVRVSSGPNLGNTGWVIEVVGEVASVVDKIAEGEIKSSEHSNAMKLMEVNLNWLNITEPPHQQRAPQLPSSNINFARSRRHPWCGLNIIVSKTHHPHKGSTGEVKEVLSGQSTVTGIKLDVQLTRYDPSSPFRRILVDYDDVIEATTHVELKVFLFPDDDMAELLQRQPMVASHYAASGFATPMPTDTSSSPAWDPSLAPSGVLICPSPAMRPSPAESDHTPQHVLLNMQLADMKLNVTVNGGTYKKKDLVASVCMVEDRISIRYIKYNTSNLLQPEWVTPKHPSPTHDNGLLIVIKGEHCGKYVRRIYHRHGTEATTMILAVVCRVEGSADVLTVSESKKEKDMNKDLMKPLRDHYRSSDHV
ncbi:hypothetical protein BDZ97DRAFT_1751601 [Flammula alnicola]|nr:hypothetical protein BDZ97DRAFT_1751601 [Flammula alnicola]